MSPWVEAHSQEILELARRHGMTNVRVFGSMARGEADEASDLDLLVDYAAGSNLFDQIGFKQELEERLRRTVDVATPKSLHWFIRDKVLAEAEPL
ncbi:MAG: nucleotidyltransferase family protein [Pseudomonadota bacterium]|nr:nucleotidyltransferase family protein [Pseudomonadota bacterium]